MKHDNNGRQPNRSHLVSPAEFAAEMGLSYRTIVRWIADGMKGVIPIGTPARPRYRIDSEKARRWLERRSKS